MNAGILWEWDRLMKDINVDNMSAMATFNLFKFHVGYQFNNFKKMYTLQSFKVLNS